FEIRSGKLQWDLTAEDPLIKDSHFVSLPIAIAGKLYVLNEKLLGPQAGKGGANPIPGDSELRLICLDPNKIVLVNNSPKPTIVSEMSLGRIGEANRFVQDIGRRVNAVQLAYSDGILVCPTNAGEVLGIDPLTRTLAWTYSYRDVAHQPIVLPGMPGAPP